MGRTGQNQRFSVVFFEITVCIWIEISLMFVRKSPIDNKSAHIQSMSDRPKSINPTNVDQDPWRHIMMTSSNGNIFRVTGLCAGNSPHKGQWRRALMFPLICVWINGWENNLGAGDLRRCRGHYDVTVMQQLHDILGIYSLRRLIII